MIVKIGGIEYDCRTAKAEENKVILYTGKYDENGDEIVSVFYGFRTEDIEGVEMDATTEQRLSEMENLINTVLGVNRYA